MKVTDIIATVPAATPEYPWFVQGLEAWVTAAEDAGFVVDESTHDASVAAGSYDENIVCGAVCISDDWYVLEVRNGVASAVSEENYA